MLRLSAFERRQSVWTHKLSQKSLIPVARFPATHVVLAPTVRRVSGPAIRRRFRLPCTVIFCAGETPFTACILGCPPPLPLLPPAHLKPRNNEKASPSPGGSNHHQKQAS